jgi:TonB family protein
MLRTARFIIGVALLSLATVAVGQHAAPSTNSERKVIARVAPAYPELARRMHIVGVVKVEALVRANGTVKSARVMGGNPVLIDAAVTAVGRWRFEPAQSETTEVVQVSFESE